MGPLEISAPIPPTPPRRASLEQVFCTSLVEKNAIFSSNNYQEDFYLQLLVPKILLLHCVFGRIPTLFNHLEVIQVRAFISNHWFHPG